MASAVQLNYDASFTAYDSAARTATPAVAKFETASKPTGLVVVIDITAATSTPSTVFNIDGIDPVSGKTFLLLASAALVGVQTVVLRVHHNITASANLIAKDVVPPSFQIRPVHGNANSQTYTVTGFFTY